MNQRREPSRVAKIRRAYLKGEGDLLQLRIAETIIECRKKKGVTQDELANFLGVTKASVSKWETKQSFPDILLLPQIATYFDISIDELIGYEPQLSKEQIKRCYQELANEFATKPFHEVLEKSRMLVKKYYSCYPLLSQIALLWTNHYVLAPEQKERNQILEDIIQINDHIIKDCNDVGLCSESLANKAMVYLVLGKPQEAIDTLQSLSFTDRLKVEVDPILIQAYQMAGDLSKADYYNQINLYIHLMHLISNSIGFIALHMQEREVCETTIVRIRELIRIYDVDHLNENIALQFYYQAATFYSRYEQKEKALKELTLFVHGTIEFLQKGIQLHGDDYFNRLDEWFESFALGTAAPRNDKLVYESAIQGIEAPHFSCLFEEEEYQRLKKYFIQKGGELR